MTRSFNGGGVAEQKTVEEVIERRAGSLFWKWAMRKYQGRLHVERRRVYEGIPKVEGRRWEGSGTVNGSIGWGVRIKRSRANRGERRMRRSRAKKGGRLRGGKGEARAA